MSFQISVKPQYVPLTTEREIIGGKDCLLHEVQRRMKLDFDKLPEFTVVTAPTGTGKSYAFPFPVLKSKANEDFYDTNNKKVKGLIVLPTNALINELTESFKATYPQLKISRLTSIELNERQVKGFARWETALTICKENDLVITNPDIINFAMHGGYHQFSYENKTGAREFHNFLSLFQYIIFDEYHLYDEAQIANLLTLVKMREWLLPEHKMRYFFVSATPEVSLIEILRGEEYEVEEIIETITDVPQNARPIHGRLDVEFIQTKKWANIIELKQAEIETEISEGRRVLLIANELREVQLLVGILKSMFPNCQVAESSGYWTDNIETANIIVATNKAEVGVNYKTEFCIMQTGRYFRNFVQRFGRVSRGDLTGKVIVLIEEETLFRKLKKTFSTADTEGVNYYDFLESLRQHFQERTFYSQVVPFLIGEYVWCIQNNIFRYQEFNTHFALSRQSREDEFFKAMPKAYVRYLLMKNIDEMIVKAVATAINWEKVSKREDNWRKAVKKIYGNPNVRNWVTWWEDYLKTYLAFRNSSKTVQIIDQYRDNQEVSYSLDWVLQHREIINIERDAEGDPTRYIIGNFKERDKDLQYEVSTLPSVGAKENCFLSYEELRSGMLDKVFARAVIRIIDKNKRGVETDNQWQIDLGEKLLELSKTFSNKRLRIVDIQISDSFL
jgi:CRISPR-associated endonuclease/helicase Cas3